MSLQSVSILIDCAAFVTTASGNYSKVVCSDGTNQDVLTSFTGIDLGTGWTGTAAEAQTAIIDAVTNAAVNFNGVITTAVAIGDFVLVSGISQYVPDSATSGLKAAASGAGMTSTNTAGVTDVAYVAQVSPTVLKGAILASYKAGYSARSLGM